MGGLENGSQVYNSLSENQNLTNSFHTFFLFQISLNWINVELNAHGCLKGSVLAVSQLMCSHWRSFSPICNIIYFVILPWQTAKLLLTAEQEASSGSPRLKNRTTWSREPAGSSAYCVTLACYYCNNKQSHKEVLSFLLRVACCSPCNKFCQVHKRGPSDWLISNDWHALWVAAHVQLVNLVLWRAAVVWAMLGIEDWSCSIKVPPRSADSLS